MRTDSPHERIGYRLGPRSWASLWFDFFLIFDSIFWG